MVRFSLVLLVVAIWAQNVDEETSPEYSWNMVQSLDETEVSDIDSSAFDSVTNEQKVGWGRRRRARRRRDRRRRKKSSSGGNWKTKLSGIFNNVKNQFTSIFKKAIAATSIIKQYNMTPSWMGTYIKNSLSCKRRELYTPEEDAELDVADKELGELLSQMNDLSDEDYNAVYEYAVGLEPRLAHYRMMERKELRDTSKSDESDNESDVAWGGRRRRRWGISKIAKSVHKGIKKTAKSVHKGIKKTAKNVHKGIKKAGKTVHKGLKKIGNHVVKFAKRSFAGLKNVALSIKKFAVKIGNAALKFFKCAWKFLKSLTKWIKNTLEKIANAKRAGLLKVMRFVVKKIGNIVKKVKAFATKTKSFLGKSFNKGFNTFKNAWNTAFKLIPALQIKATVASSLSRRRALADSDDSEGDWKDTEYGSNVETDLAYSLGNQAILVTLGCSIQILNVNVGFETGFVVERGNKLKLAIATGMTGSVSRGVGIGGGVNVLFFDKPDNVPGWAGNAEISASMDIPKMPGFSCGGGILVAHQLFPTSFKEFIMALGFSVGCGFGTAAEEIDLANKEAKLAGGSADFSWGPGVCSVYTMNEILKDGDEDEVGTIKVAAKPKTEQEIRDENWHNDYSAEKWEEMELAYHGLGKTHDFSQHWD